MAVVNGHGSSGCTNRTDNVLLYGELASFTRSTIDREEADGPARGRVDPASVKPTLNMRCAGVREDSQKALCRDMWIGTKRARVRLSFAVKSHHFGDLSSLRISDGQRVTTVERNDNQ